jgi:dihydropteroate synthase type 2
MHSVQARGRANKIDVAPDEIFERVRTFFEARIVDLTRAGIARERLILDPGMGFFLGSRPETSLRVLRQLGRLKAEFQLPLLVSVSRKSFLRALTGRDVAQISAATLAAELFAIRQGADYIRTHDPAALKDALRVLETLDDFGREA